MAFGGILKKIGKGVGKAALGFATGGPLGILGALGGVLGDGASAAAAGRRSDAAEQAQFNALNNQALLGTSQFNLEAPGQRVGQVARGDILSSMQDAAPTGDPRIDKFAGGGLRPSAFGASSRQAGGELQRQALMALMSGSDKITPQLSTLPKAGKLETLGGISGLIGGLAGAAQEGGLLDLLRRRSVAQMPQSGLLPGGPGSISPVGFA